MAAHFASSGAPGDVQPGGDVLVRDHHLRGELLELGDLLGRRVLGRLPEAPLAELLQPLGHRRPHGRRDGLLVELGRRPRGEPRLLELGRIPRRVAGAVEGADGDVVGPDVIGMTVAAERVVGRHDVRLVAAHEPGQPTGRLVEVRLPERARVAVAVRAHHPGVAVAEVLPLGDAEEAHGPLELAGPDLAETTVVVLRVHVRHDDLAELAARAGHQHDSPAIRDRPGHRPAGPDRLVVGVGVDGHQRRAMDGRGRVFGLVGHASNASAMCPGAPGRRYFRMPRRGTPSRAPVPLDTASCAPVRPARTQPLVWARPSPT